MSFTIIAQTITKNSKEDYNIGEIKFLEMTPVIDGKLDKELQKLEKRKFNFIYKSNDKNPTVKNSYRLAYGAKYFYIFINVESDSIIFRDRGYQNGDGLHLVFAKPKLNGEATDEFYVLGFTPLTKGKKSWQKKFIWYRNKDLSFKKLTQTEFEVNVDHKSTGYEILIPWSEIYPFHPWTFTKIGFNMSFVKATGKSEKTYHFVVYDEKIQSEQSLRKYKTISFEKPLLKKDYQYYVTLNKNHVKNGENINLNISGIVAGNKNVRMFYKILSGENILVKWSSFRVDFNEELTRRKVPINLSGTITGGYRLKIFNIKGEETFELPFTVLPSYDLEEEKRRLDNVRENISEGSYTTLLFKLEEIKKDFKKLKEYETAGVLRFKMLKFNELLSMAEKGYDKLKTKKGIFRRAYLSEVDSSLQPYSIKIPRNFQPYKNYPLLVFLHGSGQDDRNVLRESKGTILNEFIEIAPNGRGTSNAYSKDNAQDDIREAINDVIKNYSVDTTKIILSGFSMGGYGVYRTVYETPERFKALAVFSGHPNLANEWGIGNNQPNFLLKKYLTQFQNKKIFIFHGEEDRNLPINLTKELVSLLRKNGTEVTAVYEKNKGHERPSEKTLTKYYKWIEEIIR